MSMSGNQQPYNTGRDFVCSRQFQYLRELARELGGDSVFLAETSSIAPQALDDGTVRYSEFMFLLERVAAGLACPDLGMRLALRHPKGIIGPACKAIRKAPTLGHALSLLCGHTISSPAAYIWTKRFPVANEVAIGHALLVDGPVLQPQLIEQIFLLGKLTVLEITEGRALARRVLFRHQPRSSMATYRRNFGCEVYFGQPADVVIYHDQDLACPIVTSDPDAFKHAVIDIKGQSLKGFPLVRLPVRVIVTHFLGTEFCTRAFVAKKLGLHPRTMDRRLNAEGTSFLQVREEVRRDLLRYYVEETTFDFSSISEKLGFSEQSVMTKFCRKWYTTNPTRLRATTAQSVGNAKNSDNITPNCPTNLMFDCAGQALGE